MTISTHGGWNHSENDRLALSAIVDNPRKTYNFSYLLALPLPSWLKVNTDGATLSSLGVAGCGRVFKNCKGFVIGCYSFPLATQSFVHEAKLLAVISAVNLLGLAFGEGFG